MKHAILTGFAIVAGTCAFGAVVLVDPVTNATVRLVCSNEAALYEFPTRESRIERLAADRSAKRGLFDWRKNVWRKPRPVVLEWNCTADELPPFRVSVSETSDFAMACTFASKDKRRLELDGTHGNLKVATKYWWKVVSRNGTTSDAGCFTTEDRPPRWIGLRGKAGNMRDLGGWKTADGHRVKQGILYRSQGLNDNSEDGVTAGENRLMITDAAYLEKTLGIRTDLDLRSDGEVADLKESPIGPGVKFMRNPSAAYKDIFGASGKRSIAVSFRACNDPSNLPLLFHCIGGADRTGSLAFVLNGLLGVSEHDLVYDWELTFYPNVPDFVEPGNADYWQRVQHLLKGFATYGVASDPLQRRIELYLLDCGITADEIAAFRARMLE